MDRRARELRKHGIRIKLEDQPFEVLEALLERPGEVVTRGELQARIWPDGTFVDFDKSLTKAINKVRTALGDSADNPRFIETLSRRGYRFIAPVSVAAGVAPGLAPGPSPDAAATVPAEPAQRAPRRSWRLVAVAAGAVILATVLVALNVGGLRDRMLAVLGLNRIESIVVLPLENLSGDPEQEYFADGLTDELITDLGKLSSVRVISRTSAMHYKKLRMALPEIARELDVDAALEGTIQRSGSRIQLRAQLLRARTDTHL